MLSAEAVVLAVWGALAAPEVQVPSPPTPAEYWLRVTAPPSCPSEAQIHARVAELLQGPPVGEGTMDVWVDIAREDEGFSLRLTTSFQGEVGRRELRSKQCASLTDAVALVVAVALEPGIQVDSPPMGDSSPAEGVDVVARQDPVAPTEQGAVSNATAEAEPLGDAPSGTSAVERPTTPRPVGVVRAAAGVEYGGLPEATLGLQVATGAIWPRMRLELRGVYAAPRRVPGPGAFEALYQLGAIGVVVCARGRLGQVTLPLCGGAEVGAVRVANRKSGPSQPFSSPWAGAVLGAGIARRSRRLGFWLSGEVVVRWVGPRIYTGSRLAFASGPASLRMVAGLEIFFSTRGT